jgi:hypothetical protein
MLVFASFPILILMALGEFLTPHNSLSMRDQASYQIGLFSILLMLVGPWTYWISTQMGFGSDKTAAGWPLAILFYIYTIPAGIFVAAVGRLIVAIVFREKITLK